MNDNEYIAKITKKSYAEQVQDSIYDYISENYTKDELLEYSELRDELITKIQDGCYNEDSVTGVGSGSYYCNRYAATEMLKSDLQFALQTYANFIFERGDNVSNIVEVLNEPELLDVCVRCELVNQSEYTDKALKEVENALKIDLTKQFDCSDYAIYIKADDKEMIITIQEGSGDNLTQEDEEGYVDYFNFNTYYLEGDTIINGDGGQALLTERYDDYSVSDIIKMAFDQADISDVKSENAVILFDDYNTAYFEDNHTVSNELRKAINFGEPTEDKEDHSYDDYSNC